MHIFHSFAVFGAGGDDIDPSRVYTAVTENVSKFCDVLLNPVKHTSEQVAQVMRKYFFGLTFASSHKSFISRQMFVRLIGLPVRVTKSYRFLYFALLRSGAIFVSALLR